MLGSGSEDPRRRTAALWSINETHMLWRSLRTRDPKFSEARFRCLLPKRAVQLFQQQIPQIVHIIGIS